MYRAPLSLYLYTCIYIYFWCMFINKYRWHRDTGTNRRTDRQTDTQTGKHSYYVPTYTHGYIHTCIHTYNRTHLHPSTHPSFPSAKVYCSGFNVRGSGLGSKGCTTVQRGPVVGGSLHTTKHASQNPASSEAHSTHSC